MFECCCGVAGRTGAELCGGALAWGAGAGCGAGAGLCCATATMGTAANNARTTPWRKPTLEPGQILSVIAHSSSQDLWQSNHGGYTQGDRAHTYSCVLQGPREKTSKTQSTRAIRIARRSVLRRTTLSKPVRGCNGFLDNPPLCGWILVGFAPRSSPESSSHAHTLAPEGATSGPTRSTRPCSPHCQSPTTHDRRRTNLRTFLTLNPVR
jgi:hypothetical protein